METVMIKIFNLFNKIMKRKKTVSDLIISGLLVLLFAANLLIFFDYKLQDAAYQKPTETAPNITIFGIDAETLAAFEEDGRFHDWIRRKTADAINILNTYEDEKPAVIAIDILYAGESGGEGGDDALAKAASDGGNVVFTSLVHFGEELSGDFSAKKVIKEHETPYPLIADNAPYGFSNGNPDRHDGLIREAVLKLPYDGKTLYGFPVETYWKYAEYTGEKNSVTDDFIAGNHTAYITYYGNPGEYACLPFADIFDDDFEPDFYADEIVFIGAYAPGFMDAYYTPMSHSTQMYGVEIHANVLQMLIEGNFKKYVPRTVSYAVLFFVVLLSFVLIKFIKDLRVLFGIFVLAGAGYYFLSLFIFSKGYILTLIYPIFSLAVIYIYQVVYGYILETVEKRKLRSVFQKYVDPKLVDRLVENAEAAGSEIGVKRNIAVLFVDIRGFTPITEMLKDHPEFIVQILNEYFELTASAIFNNDGSVDKFIGDATMALFNGFFNTDQYVFKAVKTAWDMVQGAIGLNASIKEKYNVDLGFGIGINCGDAIVGNLGPSFRKDYTAIGDTVNTAARLENIAHRSEILITKDVHDIVKDKIEAVSMGKILLKGKNTELEIFSVKNILI